MLLRDVARVRRSAGRGGFTLLEVMLVVAILVILAGTGGVVYFRYMDEAKNGTAKMGVKAIETAVNAYYFKNGDYPPNLQILTQRQADGSPAYLEVGALLDPWKNQYSYTVPGQHHASTGKPDIWSNGAPSAGGAAPIGNWSNSTGLGE